MIDTRELACGQAGRIDGILTCAIVQGECVLLSAPPGLASPWLSMIAGMTRTLSGRIHLAGHDMTLRPLERRRIAFHAGAVMPVLAVTVDEYLQLAGAGRPAAARMGTADIARLSGLPLTRPVDTLDPAAMQTLGLAAALASGAAVLLVDAPLATGTGEDHARRRAVLTEARHSGRTLLVTGLSSRDPLVDRVVEAGA